MGAARALRTWRGQRLAEARQERLPALCRRRSGVRRACASQARGFEGCGACGRSGFRVRQRWAQAEHGSVDARERVIQEGKERREGGVVTVDRTCATARVWPYCRYCLPHAVV